MINVVDVWKSFGAISVLKGLSLKVEEGETLVILGRSGVGKSVLLKLILGIDSPDKGEIWVNGENMTASQKYYLNPSKRFGMLFQGAALFDSMTVAENIAFYLQEHQSKEIIKDSTIRDMVEDALSKVGLQGCGPKMPSDLSGGQKKRAALARAIIYRPEIMFYDEPTTGLDPITAQQINELIRETQEELSATNIVVTHDLHSAFYVADKIALHDSGIIKYLVDKNEFACIDDPIIYQFMNNTRLPDYTRDMK